MAADAYKQSEFFMLQNLFAQLLRRLLRHKSMRNVSVIIVLILGVAGISLSGWLPTDNDSDRSNSSSDLCEVKRVSDGDTLTVICASGEEKVRMYCIDTPEMKQEPWGQQARTQLQRYVDIGAQVRLERIEKDRYGRTVAEVYKGDKNLNLAQVEVGQAAVYTRFCKKPIYQQVEQKARAAGKGIWAESGLQQAPWQWRKENQRN